MCSAPVDEADLAVLPDERFAELLSTRAHGPSTIAAKAARRPHRQLPRGNLMVIAVDHPARRIMRVGADAAAMADRRRLLAHTIRALRRPGVDGVMATPDILEDLLLLDELDHKVVFGSMNRSGLTGSAWELDDRFTGYDARTIERFGFNGGKMLLRIDLDDPDTNETISACAAAISELAGRQLIAMVEPLPVFRTDDDAVRVSEHIDDLVAVIGVASALGTTSAYTWLKLPAPDEPERMMAATTMPALLLGGDPGSNAQPMLDAWRRAMALPNVIGLTAGRSLLFPADGDVEAWVDTAVAIVHGDDMEAVT